MQVNSTVGGHESMNYWMFTIMYDEFPESWKAMVDRGIAAQHYPPGWPYEARNIRKLQKLKCGDMLVAAFKAHRFAGYGVLKSDFYRDRDGKSLRIERNGKLFEFSERVDIDWTVMPPTVEWRAGMPRKERPFINCKNLKKQGYNIDLTRGLCVRSTDERTFTKLRDLLDQAGATSPSPARRDTENDEADEVILFPEGRRVAVRTERVERSPAARRECIRVHGTKCCVCNMDFEDMYGEIGKGYIEVHHLKPLSAANGERPLDPVVDLRSVCPNCHAMLHRQDPPFTIEDLRTFYRRSRRRPT